MHQAAKAIAETDYLHVVSAHRGFADAANGGIEAVAEKIRGIIENYNFEDDEETYQVTISIGVAEPGESYRSAEEVMKQADKALYRAKKKGRNCLST